MAIALTAGCIGVAAGATGLADGGPSAQATEATDEVVLSGLNGSGTTADPYVVTNATELQAMAADPSAHYALAADVNASATRDWNVDETFDDAAGFEPVGNGSNPDPGENATRFTGTFDGQGHAIEGLYVDHHAGGLFGRVGQSARVEDVHVRIAEGSNVAGGLVAVNHGTVANASVTGNFTAEGGLVGSNAANGTVRNSSADVALAGSGSGGLVGENAGVVRDSWSTGVVGTDGRGSGGLAASTSGLIADSWSNATVNGTDAVGGLVGSGGGEIRDSRATGDVNGSEFVGGLAGDYRAAIGDIGQVRRSYATGDVSGHAYVGGLIGLSETRIVESYATGDVVRTDGASGVETEYYGGLVGRARQSSLGEHDASIRDGYATGDVRGREAVGALAGSLDDVPVERAYATGVADGDDHVGGVVGHTGDDTGTAESTGTTHWGVAATDDLDAIAASDAWRATDRYPVLAWQADDRAVPADAVPAVSGPPYETGRTVTLDATDSFAAAGIATYEWTITGETIAGEPVTHEYEGERVTHAFAEAGEYEVTLTVTDAEGRTDEAAGTVSVARGTDGLAGNGTAADPYRIETARDLRAIDEDLDAHYVLANDVDASETATWNDGAGMRSVATNGGDGPNRVLEAGDPGPFLGTLDGQGHAIENLTLADELVEWSGNETHFLTENRTDSPDPDAATVGRIENLTLENVSAPNSATLVQHNDGTISNVTVTGAAGHAGLVGTNDGVVRDAGASVDVEGSNQVGGLVSTNNGEVIRSWARGDVAGEKTVGGLVGSNAAGYVAESWASGDVSGDESVGGLVGFHANATRAFSDRSGVVRSYATGDVTGERAIGGLVGSSRASVEQAYATGRVRGDAAVGGLVGQNATRYGDDGPATASAAYWDREATGQDESVNGTGLATARMTGTDASEHMTGFDFEDTWEITEGYPVLAANDERSTGHEGPSVNVYLDQQRTAIDERVNATLVASAAPEGIAGYVVEVTAANASVASITNATVADGFEIAEAPTHGPDGATVRLHAADAEETVQSGAGEVELATVALRSEGPGATEVDVSVERLTDDAGGPVVPATRGASLEVVNVTTEPIDGVAPQDIDADWKYEDLNGNGDRDLADVVTFFQHYRDPVITDHVRAYDFNENGRIELADVVALFQQVA